MRTCKRKTKRGTLPEVTYMEMVKGVLVEAFSLRKSSAK
jgi:hypothetical protein